MITGLHRVKLIAFVVIAVVSIAFVGVNYAGFSKVLGTGGYVVTARFDEPGGIFVGAEVTYRGVAIGSVSDMYLTDKGLAVELTVRPEAPPIPADASATVSNRSPIGEQYVDLRPTDSDPPYLSGGAVIPNERTSVPTPVSNVLLNLNQLVNSINKDALRTIVDEAYDAFAGTGDALQVLLDTASSFSATALENMPQTQQLLGDARTVLQTQRQNSENIVTLADGFAEITATLKSSDQDIRTVIDQAPAVSKEVRTFLAKSSSDLSVLFANLLTTSRVSSKRTGSLETLLVALPVVSAQSTSRAPHGYPRLGIPLNFFNPPSCTKGYDTNERPPTDTSPSPVNLDAYCAEPAGSQTGVRGAQNAPYAGNPVQVSPPQGGPGGQPDVPAGEQAAAEHGSGQGGSGRLPGLLDLSAPGSLGGAVGMLLGAGD